MTLTLLLVLLRVALEHRTRRIAILQTPACLVVVLADVVFARLPAAVYSRLQPLRRRAQGRRRLFGPLVVAHILFIFIVLRCLVAIWFKSGSPLHPRRLLHVLIYAAEQQSP